MALTRFSNEEMILVTSRWVDPASPARAILTANAVFKPLVPQIDAIYPRLLVVQKSDPNRQKLLSGQATAYDGEHDFWLEKIVTVCDEVDATAPELGLQGIRNWLFPRGLAHAGDTYATEVGYAQKKATEIDAARKKQLKGIIFGQTSLYQWVLNWQAAATKLGEVQIQRAETPGSPEDGREVRWAWLGLVKGMLASAKLAGLTDDEYTAVFGLLLEISSRKPVTKAKGDSGQDPVDPPAPEPTPPEPAPTPALKAGEDKK